MLRVFFVVTIVCFSGNLLAADIVRDLLEGKWLVFEANKKDVRKDNEEWEFSKNTLRLISNGKTQDTVIYEVSGDTIYIDSIRMKVHDLTDSEMVVEDNGVLYKLYRQ